MSVGMGYRSRSELTEAQAFRLKVASHAARGIVARDHYEARTIDSLVRKGYLERVGEWAIITDAGMDIVDHVGNTSAAARYGRRRK